MLDLAVLNLQEMELPPCFAVKCEGISKEEMQWCGGSPSTCVPCGQYKGKLAAGFAYVIGASRIDSYSYDPEVEKRRRGRCPRCTKQMHRRLDRESFELRFKWLLEQKGGLLPRCKELMGDCFPCLCKGTPGPALRPISKMLVKVACTSDAFITDTMWVRLHCKVECAGCKAQGQVAYLEQFADHYLHEDHWIWQPPPYGERED